MNTLTQLIAGGEAQEENGGNYLRGTNIGLMAAPPSMIYKSSSASQKVGGADCCSAAALCSLTKSYSSHSSFSATGDGSLDQ